jgi:hypothetical protein
MLLALFGIVDLLLDVLRWIIIIQAILSWLVAFNVINTSNDFMRSFLGALDTDHRAALPADPARSYPISAASTSRRWWRCSSSSRCRCCSAASPAISAPRE